jgi:hypothetical protein
MTDPVRTTAPAEHARHDLSIVAVLAARPTDLDEKDSAAARAQVASCSTCADALADLLALQTTLPETATPPRPRDFRLTPADAQRLHRSGWRRFLGYFGSPRDGFSRPLAIGLTTLGLAGILLATIPSTFIGGSGAAAPANEAAPIQQAAPAPAASVPSTDRTALGAVPASAAPSAAASAPAEVAAAAPSASTVVGGAAPGTSTEAASASADIQVFTGGNPDEVAPDLTGGSDSSLRADATDLSTLLVVGGVLLIAGLGLFALRWSGRRLS